MEKRALFVIPQEGFRDEEYAEPKKILEAAGVGVETASTGTGQAVGKLGMRTLVDLLYTDAVADEYAAVVFIGGPGSPGYWDDPAAHRLLQEAAAANNVVGGICSACVTLARSGVLKGKRATVWPGDAEVFRPHVGEYTAAECERDGLFVTANGPAAAEAFGQALVEMVS